MQVVLSKLVKQASSCTYILKMTSHALMKLRNSGYNPVWVGSRTSNLDFKTPCKTSLHLMDKIPTLRVITPLQAEIQQG